MSKLFPKLFQLEEKDQKRKISIYERNDNKAYKVDFSRENYLSQTNLNQFFTKLENYQNLNELTLSFRNANLYYSALGRLGNSLKNTKKLTYLSLDFSFSNTTTGMLKEMFDNLIKMPDLINLNLNISDLKLSDIAINDLILKLIAKMTNLQFLDLNLENNLFHKEIFFMILINILENLHYLKKFNGKFTTKNSEYDEFINLKPLDKTNESNFILTDLDLKITKESSLNIIELYNFLDYFSRKSILLKSLSLYLSKSELNGYGFLKIIEILSCLNILNLNISSDLYYEDHINTYLTIPEFNNLKYFKFITNELKFSENGLNCALGKICQSFKKLDCLILEIPFYEYDSKFFENLMDSIKKNEKLRKIHLKVNFLYLLKSQIEKLLTILVELKNLKFLELVFEIKTEFDSEYENVEDCETDGLNYFIESLTENITKMKEIMIFKLKIMGKLEKNWLKKELFNNIYKGFYGKSNFALLEMPKELYNSNFFTKLRLRELDVAWIVSKRLNFRRNLIKAQILEKLLL